MPLCPVLTAVCRSIVHRHHWGWGDSTAYRLHPIQWHIRSIGHVQQHHRKYLHKRWRHHFLCDHSHYQQRGRTPEVSFCPNSSPGSHESVCPGEGCPEQKRDNYCMAQYYILIFSLMMFRFTYISELEPRVKAWRSLALSKAHLFKPQ